MEMPSFGGIFKDQCKLLTTTLILEILNL